MLTASDLLPVSVVIATRNRVASLTEMLSSLRERGTLPVEIVVVDASSDVNATSALLDVWRQSNAQGVVIKHESASEAGAATQRNQGVAAAAQPFIWFIDDDVVFESDCADQLFRALQADSRLGGVNAMIANQRYETPGLVSRFIFTLMHGRREKIFAGKVIGPAINLLPEDSDDLPQVVPVEWLNTTCTMYRREALPTLPFDQFFKGYSLMEDVALSLKVAQRGWKLSNVRTARIFHNSQSKSNNANVALLAAMELRNRYYVMTKILGRHRVSDYFRLAGWELFSVLTGNAHRGLGAFGAAIKGKWCGWQEIRRGLNCDE